VPLWLIKRQLKSSKPEVRRKAVEQLCEKPDHGGLNTLREALTDSDPEVRRLAAVALGKLEGEERLDPLLAALRDRDPEVQKSAITALKKFSGPQVVTALRPLLRSSDGGVRGHAAHTLQLIGWRPESRDETLWFSVAQGQFGKVTAFGVAAIPVLEEVLSSGQFQSAVGAVQALGWIQDQRVLRPLLASLKSPDPAVCVAALGALARVGNEQVIEPVAAMARHKNAQVRLATVETLGDLRATGKMDIFRRLLSDEVWEVRKAAAETLGRFKDGSSVEALTRTLSDKDADVRETTAMSLGRLMDRRAIGPLVMALKDSASGVRRIAAATLARIDPAWSSSEEAKPGLEALKPALDDEDPEVRHFVGNLLGGLARTTSQPKPSASTYGEDDETAFLIREGRRKLALSLFTSILSDRDRDLRQAAAESLGRIADARAESALVRAAADEDAGVRIAASRSLSEIQKRGAAANP
jgi:HEAT repeat protein